MLTLQAMEAIHKMVVHHAGDYLTGRKRHGGQFSPPYHTMLSRGSRVLAGNEASHALV